MKSIWKKSGITSDCVNLCSRSAFLCSSVSVSICCDLCVDTYCFNFSQLLFWKYALAFWKTLKNHSMCFMCYILYSIFLIYFAAYSQNTVRSRCTHNLAAVGAKNACAIGKSLGATCICCLIQAGNRREFIDYQGAR